MDNTNSPFPRFRSEPDGDMDGLDWLLSQRRCQALIEAREAARQKALDAMAADPEGTRGRRVDAPLSASSFTLPGATLPSE